jgi:hypothetical protein
MSTQQEVYGRESNSGPFPVWGTCGEKDDLKKLTRAIIKASQLLKSHFAKINLPNAESPVLSHYNN